MGVWIFLRTFHFVNVLDSTAYSSVVYLFISTGCLVILVATLGCCAIPKHRTKLLFCVSKAGRTRRGKSDDFTRTLKQDFL